MNPIQARLIRESLRPTRKAKELVHVRAVSEDVKTPPKKLQDRHYKQLQAQQKIRKLVNNDENYNRVLISCNLRRWPMLDLKKKIDKAKSRKRNIYKTVNNAIV